MWRPTEPRLIGALIFVFLAAILAANVSALAASPSPSPSPPAAESPSPSASPGSPSPAASPTPRLRQQQDEYHAYISTVTIDGAGLMAALVGLRSCHDNRDACRQAIQQADDRVKAFQTDLDRTTAPECMANVDAQLRLALGFYDSGLGLVKSGGQTKDQLKVIQGGILIGVGTWKFSTAVREARRSSC